MRDGINLLADWCKRVLRVVSVTEQLDLSGMVSRIVAGALFGMAEIQHTQIRERQAAGIALPKQQGVYKGRAQGVTKARPERARALCEQGLSIAEMVTALGVSKRTVMSYLKQCPPAEGDASESPPRGRKQQQIRPGQNQIQGRHRVVRPGSRPHCGEPQRLYRGRCPLPG
jgi:DNA invertase Pin-like site-specific DNA recombinase